MAKRLTHNLVRYMGEVNRKAQWKECGRVVHDDVTGKDVLWVNPAAMRNAIKGHDTDEGVPFLLFPKTSQVLTPRPYVAPQDRAPNPPFDTPPPGMVTPVEHKYNEPPIDFDDEIPFAPIGKQYPAILYCM